MRRPTLRLLIGTVVHYVVVMWIDRKKIRTNFSVFASIYSRLATPINHRFGANGIRAYPAHPRKFSIGLHMCGRNNNWIVCSWNARQRSNERHRSVCRSVFVRDIGMMHGTHRLLFICRSIWMFYAIDSLINRCGIDVDVAWNWSIHWNAHALHTALAASHCGLENWFIFFVVWATKEIGKKSN